MVELNNEVDRMYHVNEPGHDYELHNMEDGTTQHVMFIKKEPVEEGSTEMKTVHNGTTNEAVLQMMIDRMEWLDERMPSEYNKRCIEHLKEALSALLERTKERKERGVEGTHQA